MLGLISQICFIANVLLWSVIIVVFVGVKIRTKLQQKKYSVKTSGDVSTEYKPTGLK